MYELVNTSVPNGIIAGTHGFATVAMTKGMPDAIRTRLENFCAYPHRTSAHDQRYWSENPVNWFHLTLSGGDHVVGRTAPAEFDYTGRTNRLSRVLYFPTKEMPLNGGAFVLASEERRFCESWSGDPRYLKEDRATADKLRMAASVSGGEPLNWIKLFGPRGREYARRFAILLAKNITSSGKSIYFKASPTHDSDGARLLGLFSDLINLLPEELAPRATFSTFSACVPNGVTCHLRGVFDKDRAFEAASALSPWVDCEACEIKHAELLPTEVAMPETPSATADIKVPAGGAILPPGGFAEGGRCTQHRSGYGARGIVVSPSNRDPFIKWVWVVGIALVLAVIGGGTIWYYQQERRAREYADNVKLHDEVRKWENKGKWKIEEYEDELKKCAGVAEADSLLSRVEQCRKELEDEWKNALYGGNGVGSETHKYFENGFAQLIDKIKHKRADLNNKQKESPRDSDKKVKPPTEPENAQTNRVENAKSKEAAKAIVAKEKEAVAAEKKRLCDLEVLRAKSLKELVVTKVYPQGTSVQELVKALTDDEKQSLTNKGSIAIWFLKGKKCHSTRTELSVSKKNEVVGGRSKAKTVYKFPEVDTGKSPWSVVNMTADARHVHIIWRWLWREWLVESFFYDGKINKAKLVKSVFGSEEAYEIYSRFSKGKMYFVLEPLNDDFGLKQYYYIADVNMSVDDVFDELLKLLHEKDNPKPNPRIKQLETDMEKPQAECDALNSKINKAKNGIAKFDAEIAKLNGMSDKEKKAIGFGNKSGEENQREKIKNAWPGKSYGINYKNDWDSIRNELNGAIKKDADKIGTLDKKITGIKGQIERLRKEEDEKNKANREREAGILKSGKFRIRFVNEDEMRSGCKFGWNRKGGDK